MEKIIADSKTVRILLREKYAVDYYQREYKWATKNIMELLEDLEARFMTNFDKAHARSQVQRYSRYFLGSIVVNHESGQKFIIDGQQRLTSLTLLLIYLDNLQRGCDPKDSVEVGSLIFSQQFGERSFNLNVPDREGCMNALLRDEPFDATNAHESIQNIAARYADIVAHFPETLKGEALPYFIDWLIENVDLVEITAYSDDDAYTVFETMNDRGLSLTPTEMLKGYLLSNIDGAARKESANEVWKRRVLEFTVFGKEEDATFFKAWLRAKYATSIRPREKNATDRDFEKIGTTYNKWVRDEHARIGLQESDDYWRFITRDFVRFSDHYLRLRRAALKVTDGLEYVYYNAYNSFTLQYPLILAAVRVGDDQDTVDRKIRLVAGYIDIFIARYLWNQRILGYSSMFYTIFNLILEVRDRTVAEIADILRKKVADLKETFATNDGLGLHQMNRPQIRYLLARITQHIEAESGIESSFVTYTSREIKKPFEIEHIWADKFDQHRDEFDHPENFAEYRNRIGGLVLLPRGVNQSFSAAPYAEKVKHYYGENLLAKSLTPDAYKHNPSFVDYMQRSGLPFTEHAEFKKADIEARQHLYRSIAEEIWSPRRFDREVEGAHDA